MSRCSRLVAPLRMLVASLAVGAMLLGCARGAQVVVKNESGMALTDVVLSGTDFSQQVGTIPPHSEARVSVHPKGESGIVLRGKAGGKTLAFGPDGYFEGGGYIVTLVVTPSLAVSVASTRAY